MYFAEKKIIKKSQQNRLPFFMIGFMILVQYAWRAKPIVDSDHCVHALPVMNLEYEELATKSILI